jgi:hypothetical protein
VKLVEQHIADRFPSGGEITSPVRLGDPALDLRIDTALPQDGLVNHGKLVNNEGVMAHGLPGLGAI